MHFFFDFSKSYSQIKTRKFHNDHRSHRIWALNRKKIYDSEKKDIILNYQVISWVSIFSSPLLMVYVLVFFSTWTLLHCMVDEKGDKSHYDFKNFSQSIGKSSILLTFNIICRESEKWQRKEKKSKHVFFFLFSQMQFFPLLLPIFLSLLCNYSSIAHTPSAREKKNYDWISARVSAHKDKI